MVHFYHSLGIDDFLKESSFMNTFTPNPILSKFKLGKVFYLVTFSNTIEIKKVMVANFVDAKKPIVRIMLTSLGKDGERNITFVVEQTFIPIKEQKKDTIFTNDITAFCTDKQAALNLIKRKVRKNFTMQTYLNVNFQGAYQHRLMEAYKKAITLLKTL